MKRTALLLSLGVLLSLTGCEAKQTVETPVYYLTSSELVEQEVRQKNVTLYKEYLGTLVELVTDQPYDVLQQMVYSTLPEKEQVYDVSLYKRVEPVTNPSYVDVLGESPQLQYIGVTSESELPSQIMDNLAYGYYGIELDGTNYILEVLHNTVDLSGWEESYSKMVELETKEVE